MNKLILLFLIIITWGCSPQNTNQIPKKFQNLKNLTVYSVNAKPGATISFKKDAIYGDSNEALIGRIEDVTVDILGRVFIADSQEQVIYVLEHGGRVIAQLGREGRGPSEFGFIKSLQIRKGRLYAFDFNQNRVNVFSLDTLPGEKTILLAGNKRKYPDLKRTFPSIDELYVRNNDTYIAKFISDSSQEHQKWQNYEIKGLFYLLDANGMIASKLFEFTSETRTDLGVFVYPVKSFFGNALTVLTSDNSIYWAGPDHLLIKIFSPDGAYRHAFYYPHKKIPLTQEFTIEAGVPDFHINNMKSMDLPQTWPVLTDMKIDDQDRLWIATTVEDMNVYEWWMLETTGELITKFEWPRDEPIEEIKNGYMYTRETDEETGLQQVVRYRFEFVER